jgi:serine/threonine protein kinase
MISPVYIKPENIFYDRTEDKFILADFDLSFDSIECFANRVATPTTIPPELMQDTYTLTTNKGDIFSLGVTISTLLVGTWYHMYNEKYDEVTYNNVLGDMLLLLDKVPFRYKEELVACLAYNYTLRPTCNELAYRLSVRTVYPPVRREHVDTYGLYNQLVSEFRSFAQTTPLVRSVSNTIPLVIRPEHIAKILTTFFSTKQFKPDTTSYYRYACAGLLLSSIMCMSNPIDLRDIVKAYINKFTSGTLDEDEVYYTVIDLCESLDFKLLFVR